MAALALGSRLAKSPQNTPTMEAPLSNARFSGNVGIGPDARGPELLDIRAGSAAQGSDAAPDAVRHADYPSDSPSDYPSENPSDHCVGVGQRRVWLVQQVLDDPNGDRDWRLDEIGEGIIRVDPQRITQAMVQLASNAVRHSSSGDTIVLGSSLTDDGGRRTVRLWVRDFGPGIAPEDQERIFERFARAGSPRAHRPGAGLGLAIVRAIAEAHRGTVHLDSALGRGSTFTFILPVDERSTGIWHAS